MMRQRPLSRSVRLTPLLLAAFLVVGSVPASEVVYHAPPGGSARLSEAVRVGNMLYLSGKLGTLPGKRQLAPGGIQGETKQALENIRTVLARRGSSMKKSSSIACNLRALASILERSSRWSVLRSGVSSRSSA